MDPSIGRTVARTAWRSQAARFSAISGCRRGRIRSLL